MHPVAVGGSKVCIACAQIKAASGGGNSRAIRPVEVVVNPETGIHTCSRGGGGVNVGTSVTCFFRKAISPITSPRSARGIMASCRNISYRTITSPSSAGKCLKPCRPKMHAALKSMPVQGAKLPSSPRWSGAASADTTIAANRRLSENFGAAALTTGAARNTALPMPYRKQR